MPPPLGGRGFKPHTLPDPALLWVAPEGLPGVGGQVGSPGQWSRVLGIRERRAQETPEPGIREPLPFVSGRQSSIKWSVTRGASRFGR